MYRYFVAHWNPADANAEGDALAAVAQLSAVTPTLRIATRWPGVLVLVGDELSNTPGLVPIADCGVLLGTSFRRSEGAGGCAAVRELDERSAERITQSNGRELIAGYWGSYVAVLRRPDGQLSVLRDPTGAMSCYFARDGALTFLFSDLEDYLRVASRGPGINWRHVGAYLHFSRLVSYETGLEGVQQVRGGECVTFCDAGTQRAFYWHPARVYEAGVIEDPQTALLELRCAVTSSVTTWAARHERILLELSGGLDSSIVLGCLAAAGRRDDVTCFTMYTDAADGDERGFARQAARAAGCEMVEVPFRPLVKALDEMLCAAPVVSPAMATLKSAAEDTRERCSRERRIEAIFSGQGGDNLFQRRKDKRIPAEYLRRHGPGRQLARICVDTARLTGNTVWSVAVESIVGACSKLAADPYAICQPPSFWNPAAWLPAWTDAMRHPWVMDARRLPPSKTQQVFDVVDAQMFYAPRCGYAALVHPLISQPVLECALRIPCYVLTAGGRERALARRAFADSVPRQIVERTSKGAATSYFQELLLHNAAHIRARLMDGRLARAGMLDLRKLEAALSYDALMRGRELGSVLHALICEHWIASSAR